MTLPTGFSLFITWIVTFSGFICEDYQNSFWYSRYGLVSYGRPVSEGTYQGSLSRLACSRVCSETASCKSFQHSGADGNDKPSCYTFTSYTHSRRMVPLLQTNYYEKRTCMDLFETSAAVFFADVEDMFLFRGSTMTRIGISLLNDEYSLNIYWQGPVSAVFPGFHADVDGATEYYGDNTMLISGNSVLCYSRNGLDFTSISCPTDLIADYFTQSGFSDLGAITSMDLTFRDLHVFRNDVTYHLSYDETEAKYVYNGSLQMSDGNSRWSRAPYRLSAACNIGSDSYIMFETHKLYFYFASPSKRVTAILYWCLLV
ncbi:uncharacterized protein LOC121378507 [Gigantopelta aegis]|uniref:uncharacterized protein LOC121378507 n=1 Tax=Gigantopelta aegis TaxID=1735272 RepID=UPI001B888AE2|nr:uncharacterized protein LOC121378507 [Gigantopelta aegis]